MLLILRAYLFFSGSYCLNVGALKICAGLKIVPEGQGLIVRTHMDNNLAILLSSSKSSYVCGENYCLEAENDMPAQKCLFLSKEKFIPREKM